MSVKRSARINLKIFFSKTSIIITILFFTILLLKSSSLFSGEIIEEKNISQLFTQALKTSDIFKRIELLEQLYKFYPDNIEINRELGVSYFLNNLKKKLSSSISESRKYIKPELQENTPVIQEKKPSEQIILEKQPDISQQPKEQLKKIIPLPVKIKVESNNFDNFQNQIALLKEKIISDLPRNYLNENISEKPSNSIELLSKNNEILQRSNTAINQPKKNNERSIEIINAAETIKKASAISKLNTKPAMPEDLPARVEIINAPPPVINSFSTGPKFTEISTSRIQPKSKNTIQQSAPELSDIINAIEKNSGGADDLKKLDVNSVSFEDLKTISELTDNDRFILIQYRNDYGFFKTIEDLKNIPGYKNKFEIIKKYFYAGAGRISRELSTPSIQSYNQPIINNESEKIVNINTADSIELMKTLGLSELEAYTIIHYRNRYGKFSSKEEFKKIPILGAKYEIIKDKIEVN